MAALLGGLGTVCCVPPQQLSPLSQELKLEEGSLVPANPSSQDLDNRIDDLIIFISIAILYKYKKSEVPLVEGRQCLACIRSVESILMSEFKRLDKIYRTSPRHDF